MKKFFDWLFYNWDGGFLLGIVVGVLTALVVLYVTL